MQAYSMSAQAGQNFPLSVLFELLHVDGKERILPVLKQNDAMLAQMQQMQQENQMLAQQNQELNASVANLQQLNQRYADGMRGGAGGMYPSAGATDDALPGMDAGPEGALGM